MSLSSVSLTSGHDDSWYSLREATHGFLSKPLSNELGKLGSALFSKSIQQDLRNPLNFPVPNSNSRAQVEKNCDDSTKNQILRLSDDLSINEELALKLFKEASNVDAAAKISQALGDISSPVATMKDPFHVALKLHYFQRQCLLEVIAVLLQVRDPAWELSAAKQTLVLEATDMLLVGDSGSKTLVSRLFELIESHNKRLTELLSPQCRGMLHLETHLTALYKERRTLCECLFRLFYCTQALDSEATAIIQMCFAMSSRWVEFPQEYKEGSANSSASLQGLYLLLMAYICTLNRKNPLYVRNHSRRTGQLLAENQLASNQAWIKSVNALLLPGGAPQSKKQHDGVTGFLLLGWGLFLSYDPFLHPSGNPALQSSALESADFRISVFQHAFQNRALAFTRGIVHCSELAHDPCRVNILEVIDETVVELVSLISADGNGVQDTSSLLLQRCQLEEGASYMAGHQSQTDNVNGRFVAGRPMNMYNDMSEPGLSTVPEPLCDSLEDLVNLIASLCRLEPSFARKFWFDDAAGPVMEQMAITNGENQNPTSPFAHLRLFLQETQSQVDMSSDPHSMYIAFLDMLAALGGVQDEECALALFQFLQNSNGEVSLNSLMTMLERFTAVLENPQGNGQNFGNFVNAQNLENGIVVADQVVIACILRVLRSVAQSAKVCEFLLQQERANMLGSNLNARNQTLDDHLIFWAQRELYDFLKAEVFQTLCALVKTDAVAHQIWTKLDKVGAPSQANGVQHFPQTSAAPHTSRSIVEYVRMDLENQESVCKAYPVSRAFQELVWKLLHRTRADAVTPKWHSTTGPIDLQPYMDFVVNDIFIRHGQRGYRKPAEHWALAASALKVLVEVLVRYDVEQDFRTRGQSDRSPRDSPGFWLMSQLLGGGQLYKRVVELLLASGAVDGLEKAAALPVARDIESAAHQQPNQAPWFVVAGHRGYLDGKDSRRGSRDQPSQGAQGFGLLARRARPVASDRLQESSNDGGLFANWLVNAQTGLQEVLTAEQDPAELRRRATGQSSWNNGDAGGRKREEVVKLVLMLLDALVKREDMFVNLVRTKNARVSDRLERTHRLFLGNQQVLNALVSFVRYKYSSQVQLIAIRILYRVAEHSPAGALWNALGSDLTTPSGFTIEQQVIHAFQCGLKLSSSPSSCRSTRRMDAGELWNELDDKEPVEVESSSNQVLTAILQLLLVTITHPGQNIAQLILGIRQSDSRIVLGNASSHVTAIQSTDTMFGCLPTLVDMADRHLNSKNFKENPVLEQIYQLLVKLCSTYGTIGEEILYALRTQRDNFWQRHLEGWTKQLSNGQDTASENHSLAWILQGMTCELEHSKRGKYASTSTADDTLATLFMSVGAKGNDKMDQTKMRFVEIMDSIPFVWQEMEVPSAVKNAVNYVDAVGSNTDGENSCLETLEVYEGHKFFELDIAKLHWVLRVADAGFQANLEQQQPARAGPAKSKSLSIEVVTSIQQGSDEIKLLLDWALNWNNDQRVQASRAHLIQSWKRLLEAALSCTAQLATQVERVHATGRSLYYELVGAMLLKLDQNSAAPCFLFEPVSTLLLSIVSRLRAEDAVLVDATATGVMWSAGGAAEGNMSLGLVSNDDSSNASRPGSGSRAHMAANGCFVHGYRTARSQLFPEEVGSSVTGFARMNSQEYGRLLVTLVNVILQSGNSSVGVSSTPDSVARCRSALYASLLQVLQATRAMFSATLRGIRAQGGRSSGRQPDGQAVLDRHEAARASEYVFLQRTGGISSSQDRARAANPWQGNSEAATLAEGGELGSGPRDRSPLVRKLRDRALLTLDTLEADNRGLRVLETLMKDLEQPDAGGLRAVALVLMDALLPCDRHGKWLGYLERKRVAPHLASVCVRHICRTQTFVVSTNATTHLEPSYDDTIFACAMSTLSRMAQTKSGALAIVDSGFLADLTAQGPIPVLTDKRSRGSPRGGRGITPQQSRHLTVLPLLRLLRGLQTTLSLGNEGPKRQRGTSGTGTWRNVGMHPKLAKQLLEFVESQKQFIVSVLGFPPTSLADLTESALVVAILSQCARATDMFAQVLGSAAEELDSLVFASLREISAEGRSVADPRHPQLRRRERQWDEVVPVTPLEQARSEEVVTAPPDLYLGHNAGTSGAVTTLFELDKYALEMELLGNLVVYARTRSQYKLAVAGRHESAGQVRGDGQLETQTDFVGLIECVDAACVAIGALGGKSGGADANAGSLSNFRSNRRVTSYSGFASFTLNRSGADNPLASERNVEKGTDWFNARQYQSSQLKQYMFVLENALFSLYALCRRVAKMGGLDSRRKITSLLQHPKLLANYYRMSEMSALERVSAQISASENSFVHLVLRNLRELHHEYLYKKQ